LYKSSLPEELTLPNNDTNDATQALRNAEGALERALEREQHEIEEQRQYLAELAHEIKTPLNALLGYAHIMSEEIHGPLGAPEYKDYTRTIFDAATHLQKICDGILGDDDEDRGPLEIEDVDVGQMIDGVVRMFAGMAADRDVNLGSQIADAFPILRTDARRLNQVLINLVSNAVKFTPGGGSVSVEAEYNETTGAMIFVVSDTGEGIAPERLKNITRPFENGAATSPHGDKSTGLGLSIAERFARQLKGELRVASEENVGTFASVCLPLNFDADQTPTGHAEFIDAAHTSVSFPSYLSKRK
jgi:two-component system, cell cycle sensor histidine kinase PleC